MINKLKHTWNITASIIHIFLCYFNNSNLYLILKSNHKPRISWSWLYPWCFKCSKTPKKGSPLICWLWNDPSYSPLSWKIFVNKIFLVTNTIWYCSCRLWNHVFCDWNNFIIAVKYFKVSHSPWSCCCFSFVQNFQIFCNKTRSYKTKSSKKCRRIIS